MDTYVIALWSNLNYLNWRAESSAIPPSGEASLPCSPVHRIGLDSGVGRKQAKLDL